MKRVVNAFKKFFIPHEHNDYKPHFFREASILSITIIAIILLSISASSILYIKNTNMTATVLPAVLVDLTNNARTSGSEQALVRSPILDQAAALKAQDMATLGYFSHTSPAGITPWYWFDKAGYHFVYAGENLAINFTESADVENAWLNSPTHRANILNNHFTEIGIATKDGIYQGQPTTYVVQMFGEPAIVPAETAVDQTQVLPQSAQKPKVTKIATNTHPQIAITPEVKGESTTVDQNLQTLTDTKEFIAVKDTNAQVAIPANQTPTHYSTWHDRFIFLTPTYTDYIYRIFMWIVTIALGLMVILEIKRQHPKNIIYGVLLLVIMVCLIYINKTMFVTNFIV